MPYTITREDPERDLRALRRVLTIYTQSPTAFVPVLQELADSIEEQVKPAIEEPTEFASVVEALVGGRRIRLVRTFDGQPPVKEWMAGPARYEWTDLSAVEVLRVGIGEDRDVAPEETSDYMYGLQDTTTVILRKLRLLWGEARTAEVANAYLKAIKAVEEVA